jgi:sugar phosphate isomerase/epimerase
MSAHPVYVSTASVARRFRTLEQLLDGFTQNGIDRIELGHSPRLDGLVLPHGLDRFHAQFLIHNYFPAPKEAFVLNLASQDSGILQRSREFCIQAMKLSVALNAPFYSLHCGFLADFDPASIGRKLLYSDSYSYERGYSTFAESLALLLAGARSSGLRLLVEPNVVEPLNLVDGRNTLLMMAEPRELARLLADFSDGTLGVLLDVGHLKVTAATLGFGIREFVSVVAPAIGAFHLHDNDGTADQHRPLQPGSWAFEILRERRFSGIPTVIEANFDSLDEVAKHHTWLIETFNPCH